MIHSCRVVRYRFSQWACPNAHPGVAPLLTLALLLGLIAVPSLRAELATDQEMANVSRNFLTESVSRTGDWAGEPNPQVGETHELFHNGVLVARYFDVSPRGYVMVPVLKEATPVKAYSDESNLNADQEGGFLQMVAEVLFKQMLAYEEVHGSLTVSPKSGEPQLFDPSQKAEYARLAVSSRDFRQSSALGITAQGGPLLTSSWHQGAPYNNDCPMGDGGRTVVGCVATATAQILKFWEWPATGIGWHQYTWEGDNSCDGTTPSQSLFAVYTDAYDWANIPDDCNGGCNTAQQTALAGLNYEVGVAFNMDYGRCGSGAYTASAAAVFPTYFKYKQTTHVEYRTAYDLQGWFDLIKSEVDAGRPMQYRIISHSIVCDGYRDDGGQLEFHMNYGWNDSHNAWYVLDNLYCSWVDGDICPFEEEFIVAGIEPQLDPALSLKSSSFSDASGDNDGLVEAGETVTLSPVIVNGGNDATSSAGVLTTSDPYITIVSGGSAYNALIPWGGESAPLVPFQISIAPGCPDPHVATFDLSITADGGFQSNATIRVLIGSTPGFEDNVESGQGYWSSRVMSVGSSNDWHLETYRSHSSSTSWKMGGAGSGVYVDASDAGLMTQPLVLPADAKLTFWHWIDAEDDANFTAWDCGTVWIRENGGDWTSIEPEGGYPYSVISGSTNPLDPGTPCYSGTYNWSQAIFDLSAHSGVVEIMFRFSSDGGATQEGWYVDDIWVGNTLAGANVEVTPMPGVTVTFSQVATRGITTASISPDGPEPPAGFGAVPASPREYFTLATSAVPVGQANVCLAYSEGDLTGAETSLRVFARSLETWVDATSGIDVASNRACGMVGVSSTVLLAEKTSCCVARVGDANGDGSDEPTVGDVSALIDAKLITGTCDGVLECLAEADVNVSGGADPACDDVTIGDITVLIDYLFITGSSLGLSDCP